MRWVVGILLGLIPLGYLSDWVSTQPCEARMARELNSRWGGLGFYTDNNRPPPAAADTRAIFSSIGVIPLPDVPPGVEVYPRIGVGRGGSVGPFLEDVRYDMAHHRGAAWGGVRRYFCLFGWVIDLGDITEWMS
jgi:hypothetical protein